MKIEELKQIAIEDTYFDKDKVEDMITKSAHNYQKWVTFLMEEKLVFSAITMKYNSIYRDRWRYYREDFELELKQRTELDVFLCADDDLAPLLRKQEISKEKCLFIEGTIKALYGLQYQVKNYIDWLKFEGGAY